MFLYIETIHANGCLLQSKGGLGRWGNNRGMRRIPPGPFLRNTWVNRNVEATLDLMDDVQWIGTGKGEYSCGKEQVLEALEQEFSLDPDAYQLIWEDISGRTASPLTAPSCRAGLLWCAYFPIGENFAMGVRVTSTCVRTAEGFKVSSIHASVPADFPGGG